jgi:hypothetical protein
MVLPLSLPKPLISHTAKSWVSRRIRPQKKQPQKIRLRLLGQPPKPHPNSLISSNVVLFLGFHRFLSGLTLVISNTVAVFSSPPPVFSDPFAPLAVIYACAHVHILCGFPCLVRREHRGAVWCAVMMASMVMSDLVAGPIILALIWSSWGFASACVMLSFGFDLVVTFSLILAYFNEECCRRRQLPGLWLQTSQRLILGGGSDSMDFRLDPHPPYTICFETVGQTTTSSQKEAPPEYVHPPEHRDTVLAAGDEDVKSKSIYSVFTWP